MSLDTSALASEDRHETKEKKIHERKKETLRRRSQDRHSQSSKPANTQKQQYTHTHTHTHYSQISPIFAGSRDVWGDPLEFVDRG